MGIVRVSGTALAPLVQALTGRALQPRQAHYGPFLAADGSTIDQGLALFFPAPHSYTGEDVLELQAHGGPVVLQLLVARCLQAAEQVAGEAAAHAASPVAAPTPHHVQHLRHLRLAEPGEFTQRAFLNGKLDLAQAEAVADLIDAGTEAAARSAARSLQGEFSQRIDTLAQQVLHLRMLVEATLDFPEEEIDFLQKADARGQLERLQATLAQVLSHTRQGALLREGLRVVIAGQPNVGKSSLLNALAGQDVAIVTSVAGTTRDRIEQALQMEGVPLHVVDTAGLRKPAEAADEVERIGIERSWEAIRSADAVLLVRDLSRMGQADYDAADAAIAAQLADHGVPNERLMVVLNKADAATVAASAPHTLLSVSARTGAGLDALRRLLLQRAGWQALPEGVPWPVRAMCRPCSAARFICRCRTNVCFRPTPHSTCWPKSCAWRTRPSVRSPDR